MHTKEHSQEFGEVEEPVQMFPDPGEWLKDYIAWLAMVETISHEEFDREQ